MPNRGLAEADAERPTASDTVNAAAAIETANLFMGQSFRVETPQCMSNTHSICPLKCACNSDHATPITTSGQHNCHICLPPRKAIVHERHVNKAKSYDANTVL